MKDAERQPDYYAALKVNHTNKDSFSQPCGFAGDLLISVEISLRCFRRGSIVVQMKTREEKLKEKVHAIMAGIDPNDSWAQVELYRWQHGNLPGEPGTVEKPLDEAAGLRAMADALESGCKSRNGDGMPDPFNVCSVMRYAAKLIEAHR